MIFTIGSKKSYQIAIDKNGILFKVGKQKDYVGGYAFRTFEDAQLRIENVYKDTDFIVWGIKADWNNDTYANPDGGNWHHLLIDAEIVSLIAQENLV